MVFMMLWRAELFLRGYTILGVFTDLMFSPELTWKEAGVTEAFLLWRLTDRGSLYPQRFPVRQH